MDDSVSLQVDCLAISHKLHEQHRFHRSPTRFPVIMQASSFPRTRSFRDMRSITSYLIVVGNIASSRASLHPDHQLPKDLWWAHSPGCPPPNKIGKEVRPTHRGKLIPRAEERVEFLCHFYANKPGITFDKNLNSLSLMTFTFLMYRGSGALYTFDRYSIYALIH